MYIVRYVKPENVSQLFAHAEEKKCKQTEKKSPWLFTLAL